MRSVTTMMRRPSPGMKQSRTFPSYFWPSSGRSIRSRGCARALYKSSLDTGGPYHAELGFLDDPGGEPDWARGNLTCPARDSAMLSWKMTHVAFGTPRKLPKATQLKGRVAVLDI